MNEGSTQEWFLEINGRRTGPFSTEQILGLLEDGEVPETEQLFAEVNATSFITVRELSDRQQNTSSAAVVVVEEIAAEPTADTPAPTSFPVQESPSRIFVPPPRPTELHSNTEASRPVATDVPNPAPKPELGLLDALLAAKERKSHAMHAMPPVVAIKRPNPFRLQNIPRKVWTLTGTAALLFLAIWGMTHFIKQKASNLTASSPPPSPVGGVGGASAAATPLAPALNPAVRGMGNVNTPPPSLAPNTVSSASLSSLTSNHDAEREAEREREREKDREHEREKEREIASVAAAANGGQPLSAGPESAGNIVPPPPPPLPEMPPMHDSSMPLGGDVPPPLPPPPLPPPTE